MIKVKIKVRDVVKIQNHQLGYMFCNQIMVIKQIIKGYRSVGSVRVKIMIDPGSENIINLENPISDHMISHDCGNRNQEKCAIMV